MKKVLIAVSVLLLLIIASWLAVFHKLSKTWEPVYTVRGLCAPNSSSYLYLRMKTWGVTGDHRTITISPFKENSFETDSSHEYIFPGWSPFFYRFNEDTLEVFVIKTVKKPELFDVDIVIIQHELAYYELSDMVNEYRRGLHLYE